MYSTPNYFEKRIEVLERQVAELQIKLEKLYSYKLVSDRHIDAIDRSQQSKEYRHDQ